MASAARAAAGLSEDGIRALYGGSGGVRYVGSSSWRVSAADSKGGWNSPSSWIGGLIRLKASASRLEAIAIRLKAIVSRLDWRPLLFG